MPLVSVVVADPALAGALAQTHAAIEVVARWEEARGEYVQWLGAGGELAPDKIAIQAAVLDATPAADVACGAHVVGGTYAPPLACGDPLLEALAGGPFEPPLEALLVRRAIVDAFGSSTGAREVIATAAMLGARFVETPAALCRAPPPASQSLRDRVADLAAAFERLRGRAALAKSGVLGDEHRRFLDQRWSIHRVASRPVTANARTRGLGALGTVVGRAIAASMAVDSLEGFTHRARAAAPRLEREIARVRDAVEALAENGLLVEEA